MNRKKLIIILILTLLLFNLTGCINQELTDEDLIVNLIDKQDGEENTLETYDYVEKYSRVKEIFETANSISAVTNAVNVVVSGLMATATFFVDYEITSTIDDIESTDKWSEYVDWSLDKGWGSWSVNYEVFQKLP